MRTFKYNQSQKFRVIVKGVSVYVTAKQITQGIGDQVATNSAVTFALKSLEDMNATEKSAVGLCGNWNGISVQINEL